MIFITEPTENTEDNFPENITDIKTVVVIINTTIPVKALFPCARKVRGRGGGDRCDPDMTISPVHLPPQCIQSARKDAEHLDYPVRH